MSLKPPKKSDLDKKWMKKRLDRAIKIQPEYHLIVTEGTDTEPEYFGSIKDVINKKYPEKIKLDVYGEGDNTISLFPAGKKRCLPSPSHTPRDGTHNCPVRCADCSLPHSSEDDTLSHPA